MGDYTPYGLVTLYLEIMAGRGCPYLQGLDYNVKIIEQHQ